MTPDLEPVVEGPPTVAEIAAFTTRWRHVSSRAATEQERADWLADKAALLARLEQAPRGRS